MSWDLRHGRWEEALSDVDHVDAVITDPPYSSRTHSGHDTVEGIAGHRRSIGYRPWKLKDVGPFVNHWIRRCSGWFVVITDHLLAREFEHELTAGGWYVFAPLPAVLVGSRVRLLGDGPSCWTVWLVVARPRTKEMARWGTLPGAYYGSPERNMIVPGGKPLWLMDALIRDYTRPGDLVCDPCAGGGTTLHAALRQGRRAIGAEMDRGTYEAARARLEDGYQPDMFAGAS